MCFQEGLHLSSWYFVNGAAQATDVFSTSAKCNRKHIFTPFSSLRGRLLLHSLFAVTLLQGARQGEVSMSQLHQLQTNKLIVIIGGDFLLLFTQYCHFSFFQGGKSHRNRCFFCRCQAGCWLLVGAWCICNNVKKKPPHASLCVGQPTDSRARRCESENKGQQPLINH